MRRSERVPLQFGSASGVARSFGRWRVAAVAVGVLLFSAACSSGSDGSLAPVTVDSVSSSSNAGSVVTTSSVTTSLTTTSTTSTTVSEAEVTRPLDASGKPIIEIPTEWESDLDEIFGRYLLYWEALEIAAGPPEADANYSALRELTEEGAFEDLVVDLSSYRDQGLVRVLPEDTITDHVLRLPNPSVLTKTEGNEVIIQDCYVSDATFQTLDGEIKYQDYSSTLRNIKMTVIDGEWRVDASRNAAESSEGYEECAALIDELSS